MAARKVVVRRSRLAAGRRPKPQPNGRTRASADAQPGVGVISIRMYRVGFGDCFLLSLPVNGGERRHILVDCGVHARGDIGSIDRVIDDIAAETKRKLAIVIATHAHQDHISGFGKRADVFSTFEVGEVWLPWTWDPNNPDAVKLQAKHAALAAALNDHFQAANTLTPAGSIAAAAADAVANLSGNARAIDLLVSGFRVGAKVRFLKAGDSLGDPAGVTGLSVKILGPPQSPEFLAQMDPPAGQHYLRVGAADGDEGTRVEPFAARWKIDTAIGDTMTRLSEADRISLEAAASSPPEELAFALDQARNNESVVALLSYRGKNLLFAGDAQYGNWRWWLDNEKPDLILPEVSFFKVAHHGSVNATPKDALERMTDGGFAAMVSTQGTPWPSIPRVPLMQRLSEKTKQKLVRSDWLPVKGAPTPASGSLPRAPGAPPPGFAKGALWFDCPL